jgi:hypothetical protein
MLDRTAPNPREHIGANNPPSAIDFAKESTTALSDWMKDHPVIPGRISIRRCGLRATVTAVQATETTMAKKATKQSKYDWQRWCALQLVSWLPKDSRETFKILDQAREIITRLPKARDRKAAKPRSKASR